MANDVFANGREISCKSGSGKSICAFPDVCFTPPTAPPTPPGVPIPYPNTGVASDTTSGSKKVKISNKEVMLKNKSYFKSSTGDEAGSAPKKGVVTSKIKGKVYFNAWSMDVKVEGENVVRHLDLTTHNHASQTGQTPPWAHVDTGTFATSEECAKDKAKEEKACEKYKPKGDDDVCAKAGLAGPIVQSDADAVGAGYTSAGAWADDMSQKAEANDCIRARRCRLSPYDAEKDGVGGCCPSQTPDHVVPKSSFFSDGFKGGKGQAMPDWDGYKYKKAPCMCAEGASNTAGSHGLRHAHHKAFGPGAGTEWSFNKEVDHSAAGACEVFKSSECNEECIKKQLKAGHEGMGDQRRKVKHSPSGSDMSKTDIQAQIAGPQGTSAAP